MIGEPGTPRSREPDRGTAYRRDRESVADLLRRLGREGTHLVRQEVELAKAETREKLSVFERSLTEMALGGVLLLAAASVLLVAVNRGLTILLGTFMSPEVAVWVAPLFLAAAMGVVGWKLFQRARRALVEEGVVLDRTVDSLRPRHDATDGGSASRIRSRRQGETR